VGGGWGVEWGVAVCAGEVGIEDRRKRGLGEGFLRYGIQTMDLPGWISSSAHPSFSLERVPLLVH
jgi:hypothetical protein